MRKLGLEAPALDAQSRTVWVAGDRPTRWPVNPSHISSYDEFKCGVCQQTTCRQVRIQV